MHLAPIFRRFCTLAIFSVFTVGAGFGQSGSTPTLLTRASTPATVSNTSGATTPPASELFIEPELVGMYGADGRFIKVAGSTHLNMSAPARVGLRPADVPGSIDLHPLEYVVEDYEPSVHAVKVTHGHSLWVNLRDSLITFAYGRENSLQAPTHVTTDSRQRLIVSDPDLQAVHVLDLTGKSSFRIAGGPKHRLQKPAGIAVDAEDNIYVADSERGEVLVYDPQGRFLRSLGSYRGESILQTPTGIAIDRSAGILYVLDSPANELLIFDLQGRILNRVGSRRSRKDPDAFEYPTEIALRDHQLAILDSYGSRIQVLDLQGNCLHEFRVRTLRRPPFVNEIGLAMDRAGNIYVSNLDGTDVQVYRQDGRPLGLVGKYGIGVQQFRVPSGLWIDSEDHIFVADTRNSRVQVFQAAEKSDSPKGTK